VGNVANVQAKFRCAPLRIKKASLRDFWTLREVIPRRTTRVAFWDPPSGSESHSRKPTISMKRAIMELIDCLYEVI